MGTYREEHQPHRHDYRAFVHGEQQSELTAAEITKAAEELSKLRRQMSLRDAEAVEAVVQEIDMPVSKFSVAQMMERCHRSSYN